MIEARPTRFGRWFWEVFSTWGIRLRFHKFRILEEVTVKKDHAVLLIGNHISWWDGFWPLYVNGQVFKKEYHVMMLEEELSQRMFMRQGGAFSIRPGSRSVVKSLAYTQQLLQNPHNLVLAYPQGRIHSMYDSHMHFAPGIEKVLARGSTRVQVFFFAAHIEYLSFARPTVFFRIKEYQVPPNLSKGQLEKAYQNFYSQSLETHIREVNSQYE